MRVILVLVVTEESKVNSQLGWEFDNISNIETGGKTKNKSKGRTLALKQTFSLFSFLALYFNKLSTIHTNILISSAIREAELWYLVFLRMEILASISALILNL